jgi:hypothetical protein
MAVLVERDAARQPAMFGTLPQLSDHLTPITA